MFIIFYIYGLSQMCLDVVDIYEGTFPVLLLVVVQVSGLAFKSILSIGAGRPPANFLSRAAAVSAAAASAILEPSDLPPNYSAAMTLDRDPDPDRHRTGILVLRAPPIACTVWL